MPEVETPEARGQHYIKDWILYDALGGKTIDVTKWRLDVGGLVKNNLSLSYEDLNRMAQVKYVHDFNCVTRWSIKDVHWEGVSLKSVIEKAKPLENAKFIMFRCIEGYSTPVPLEEAISENSIIALKIDEKPIGFERGGPVRPFIPDLYGWKSAKWLTKIELMEQYEDGYWEQYGYHGRGRTDLEERFKSYEWQKIKKHILGVFDSAKN